MSTPRPARGPWTIAAIVLVALAAIHMLVWPLAAWFVNARADAHSARYYYPMLACAALFVLPWLISQARMSSTRALYSRGDLDLLLASPVSARVVVAARALAVAIEAIASIGIFLFPIANMNALLGGAHWLAIYPAMLASGLLASAIGLTLTVLLFKLVGPRRTRFAAQIVATFIASAFVLGGQIVNVLPERMRESLMAAFDNPAPGGLFDPRGPLWLPVRAAMGEGFDLGVWCAIAGAAFALVAVGLGPYFMASAVRSAGAAATAARTATMALSNAFFSQRGAPGSGTVSGYRRSISAHAALAASETLFSSVFAPAAVPTLMSPYVTRCVTEMRSTGVP